MRVDVVAAAKFWSRVRCLGDDECWEWQGGRGADGYGRFWLNGRTEIAHRVAFVAAGGELPRGSCVLHRCDNPPCCNPAHLFRGTQADNMADKAAKGRCRSGRLTGERHPRAKLTRHDVADMRGRHAAGATVKVLADAFGVSRTCVSDIVHGRKWIDAA